MLRELDPEERARVRRRIEEEHLRSASAVAVDRIVSATREMTKATRDVTKVPAASVRRFRRHREARRESGDER